MNKPLPEFEALLRECHIQSSYEDVMGRECRASDDTLLAILQAFGVDIRDPGDAGEVFSALRRARARRGLAPIHVAWDGSAPSLPITLPAGSSGGKVAYHLQVGPQLLERSYRIDELARNAAATDSSSKLDQRLLPLPNDLPWGYHPLRVECQGEEFGSTVISSPRLAFTQDEAEPTAGQSRKVSPRRMPADSQKARARPRDWGCFLPLYALRTQRDWGVGDFTALGELTSWVGQLGGSDCATLPLLAAYLDEPLEISPYRPASRLFWNELYVDVEAIPELATFAECHSLVNSPDFRRQTLRLRDSDLVDYSAAMRRKCDVLERLAARFFEARPTRFGDFQKFLADHPTVQDYAQFRAATERQRRPWPDWPERMKKGRLEARDFDQAVVNYHLYVQWIAVEQLTRLRREADRSGCGLYLDLPVGVDPRGYDTWRYPEQFAGGTTVGAPPDVVFTKGQDWGLPALHPQRMHENGYDLFRRVMANNMQFARRLRIDHVLGFHRLYCIPSGFGPDQGAYVRYPAEELYAVAILESHRNRCAVVGENLGTVPPEVDEEIASHGISGMWVAPYELEPGRRRALSTPPAQQVAMLNTHDMPPLAAWWNGTDIDGRIELGLVDREGAKIERAQRQDATIKLRAWLRPIVALTPEELDSLDRGVPLAPLLRSIAASPAHLMLINLEDLWLETRPQNIPGNFENQPNWRRKAKYSLEQFRQLPEVLEILAGVDALRKTKERLK